MATPPRASYVAVAVYFPTQSDTLGEQLGLRRRPPFLGPLSFTTYAHRHAPKDAIRPDLL